MNAYDRSGKPIGTSVSFPLYHQGLPILYSHMTGVIKEWQNQRVGLALKLEQRRFALERGFKLICWTYDPLRSQNNWFNLNKLGVIARTYYTNYYGKLAAELYRGTGSDRFLAEWWINSPRVRKTLKNSPSERNRTVLQREVIVNPTIVRNGTRIPAAKLNSRASGDSLLLEIPANIDLLRRRNASYVYRWRAGTRKLCLHYFRRGYVATGAVIDRSADRRSFVRLERGSLKRLLRQ